jgi:hypothetical protein
VKESASGPVGQYVLPESAAGRAAVLAATSRASTCRCARSPVAVLKPLDSAIPPRDHQEVLHVQQLSDATGVGSHCCLRNAAIDEADEFLDEDLVAGVGGGEQVPKGFHRSVRTIT